MTGFRRLALLAVISALALPVAASAQYFSEVVGFNGPPIDDPATCQEMFRIPQWSVTSQQYVVPNTPGAYDYNGAYRASGLQTEGAAAMQVYFNWVDSANPDGWVRLTTFGGPERPNPALHTQGKVRFKITNRSELFAGTIGLCLGIRETGHDVPQMSDGGGVGEIEWVGVNTTPNGITAGDDHIVDTTAAGDDVQVVPVGANLDDLGLPLGTAVVDPGPNGVLNTTPAGDDQIRFGYFLSNDGTRVPIPAITLAPSVMSYLVEWDLATGIVKVNNVAQGGGIAGFTGNGQFDVLPQRGTLEHVAITNVALDSAVLIDLAIDELRFESPVADPTPAPTVVWPIVAGDTQITVTNIIYTADQVTLYRDGNFVQSLVPTPAGADVVFTVPACITGQVYTATQRNSQTGVVSPLSLPATVVPFPPAYTFSILMDEGGGGSCNYNQGWEWVGVTAVSPEWNPQGAVVLPDDGVWQTVEIPLDDDNLVIGNLFNGNGTLDPSPTGFYTIDSLWFASADATQLGPHDVLIDRVEIVDEFGVAVGAILDMEDGVNRLGNPRGQSPDQPPTSSALFSNASYDGASCHRLAWTYNGTAPDSIGMLQRAGWLCGTSDLIPDNAAALRFHLVCRAAPQNPSIPLPQIAAPVVGEQTSVRVVNDATATSIQLYINGQPAGAPVVPTGTPTDIAVTLAVGDSVSAKQTLPGGTSDLAYPRAAAPPVAPAVQAPILVGATSVTVNGLMTDPVATATTVTVYADGVAVGSAPGGTATVVVTTSALAADAVITATQTVNNAESLPSDPVTVGEPPAPPVVGLPLKAGDLTVRLTNVLAGTTLVKVYANGVLIGSMNPQGQATVDVPVTPLVHLDQITATASNASGEGAVSTPQREVGIGNGDVLVCVGIRETNTTANIGENGGTAGAIEWLGAASHINGAPQGHPISPLASWQTLTFDPATEPVTGFTGNGVLTSTTGKGVLEHIAVSVDSTSLGRSVGTYVIYIDNVVNIGAGPGGTDVVIGSGFESYALGAEVMFQEPGYSGSTSGDVVPTVANISQITDERGNPGKAVKLSWYFVDTDVQRWVRLTTFAVATLPNPTVDITKPIRFDLLIAEVQPPPAPSLRSPLVSGDSVVRVTNVAADATLVTVFANGVPIGSVNPAGADAVDVPVSPLFHLDLITARQTGPGGASGSSLSLEVGKGNGDVLIALGIRETGDLGPLGTPGTTSGDVEWIGATAKLNGAPQGKSLTPANAWQTITFDPSTDPITAFIGDDVITATRGTIEHLALAVNATSGNRSTGPYRLYVDNVVNVGAGPGGTDFVITDFEGFATGEVLFQEPGYSGSTDIHMSYPPNFSGVTAGYGDPGQSEFLTWFWRDTTDQRWARITTSGVANVPNPIIDLTKPIRMDVLLLAGCDTFVGDLDGDGFVTIADFNSFTACMDGPQVQTSLGCICADFNEDGDVDMGDFAGFQRIFGQ